MRLNNRSSADISCKTLVSKVGWQKLGQEHQETGTRQAAKMAAPSHML